ncbi:META domain-containing protein [Roseibium suaedae]|uniref:META domain-containing protein n=1 Tax=Roseibium suaedae TaxID=735517 RepID=A0A1M7AL88_9HYPH|nr:META domain-containing protein [Roseibium suaedae]SHL43542.1 META domain-containing protein [Roseibium suaedae]
MKRTVRNLLALTLVLAAGAAAKADEVLLQSAKSGLYVTVVNGTLAASAQDARQAVKLDTVRLEGNKIAFRDVRSGTYVRAGVGQGTMLATGSPHIRSWETFELDRTGRGEVALRSSQNGLYVRAGVGRGSHLAAVSERARDWETFRLVDVRNAGGHQDRPRPGQGNGNGNHNAGQGPDLSSLIGNYRITHVTADNGFLVPLGRELAGRARMSIEGRGNLSATAGCNSISARIAVENGRFQTRSQPMSTKMGCVIRGQSLVENRISQILTEARTVQRDGRIVTLRARNGAELLKLRRM